MVLSLKYLRVIFSIFLFLPSGILVGQVDSVRFYIDTANQYDGETILAESDVAWRKLSDTDKFSTFYVNYVTFTVKQSDSKRGRRLVFRKNYDTIQLFAYPGQMIQQTGDGFWAGDLPVINDRKALPFPSEGGQYLLRISNPITSFKRADVSAAVPYLQADSIAYQQFRQQEYLRRLDYNNGQRLFLCLIALIMVTVTITYIYTKEAVYGYYLLYVASIFLYYLLRRWRLIDENGVSLPSPVKYSFEGVWSFVITLAYVQFVVSFLAERLQKSFSWLVKLFIWAKRLSLIALAMCLILLLLPNGIWWSNTVAHFWRVAFIILGVITIYGLLRSQDSFSRLIAGGIAFLIIGLGLILCNEVLNAFWNVDIEPKRISFLQLGILGELVFYLLALLWRHRELKESYVRERKQTQSLITRTEELEARLLKGANEFISLSSPGGARTQRWALMQVQGFVSEREVCRVLLADGKEQTVYLRMKEIIKQLPDSFVRVHRSYVVRLDAIESVERGRYTVLYLKGSKKRIPVGKKGSKLLKERMVVD